MKTFRLGPATLGVVSVAIVAASCALASGQVIKVVSPPSLENVEGNTFGFPSSSPTRIQFLIPASHFADVPESQRLIVAWNFRADASQNQSADWAYSNTRMWMSTTDKTTLTLTNVFDNNHGADKTLVQDGAVSLPLLAMGPPQGPRDFADGPRLETPFFYDPSQGNLLVEWVRLDVSAVAPRIDAHLFPDPGATVLLNTSSATAATGNLANQPPALQFEFVPEPSTFVLASVALVGLLAWRRKTGGLRRPMRRDWVD